MPSQTQSKEETLETLLHETEKTKEIQEKTSLKLDKAIIAEIESIEGKRTKEELELERDILSEEIDLTRKIEAELWNASHIACLPYFYETYTIQARIEPELQARYNKATIATCSRFKVLGKNGLAIVSPLIDFIRNYQSYTPHDRKELDATIFKRIITWLEIDIVPQAHPRPILTKSLEKILADIEEAEKVFMRTTPSSSNYMEGEAVMAAIKAIRNSAFLPSQVKIRLLQSLKNLNKDEVYDIGTFLLWEIRKSSHHQNLLLYTMLKIFQELSLVLRK